MPTFSRAAGRESTLTKSEGTGARTSALGSSLREIGLLSPALSSRGGEGDSLPNSTLASAKSPLGDEPSRCSVGWAEEGAADRRSAASRSSTEGDLSLSSSGGEARGEEAT